MTRGLPRVIPAVPSPDGPQRARFCARRAIIGALRSLRVSTPYFGHWFCSMS
jgi:hypothetical protein